MDKYSIHSLSSNVLLVDEKASKRPELVESGDHDDGQFEDGNFDHFIVNSGILLEDFLVVPVSGGLDLFEVADLV